jgi:hypothetical protein
MTQRPTIRTCAVLLVFTVAALLVPGHSGGAVADDLTPTIVITSPEPTVEISTPEPSPTAAPTVVRERTKPIVTAVLVPTAVHDVLPPTSTPVRRDYMPTGTAPPLAPTPLDAVTPVSAAPIVIPTLSVQQLQTNTRLRWGHGLPAAVRQWAFLIVPASHRYNVPPMLIAAVMTMESGGDPLALSPADARGLMQVLHGPWDPKENVNLGVKMLAGLYSEFGQWDLALAGYNAGPGAVVSYHGVPPYHETRDYVVIVSYLWDLYSHHHLSSKRKLQYRKTLTDLVHYKGQGKKVSRLAHVAAVPDVVVINCDHQACNTDAMVPAAAVPLDPFWPMQGSPDPLQHVDPIPSLP